MNIRCTEHKLSRDIACVAENVEKHESKIRQKI